MSKTEPTMIWPHEDAALFRAAVTYTATQTAFPSRLIEKAIDALFCLRTCSHVP